MSAVVGVRLASTAAGIRYVGRNDLVLMELTQGTQATAVFTRNSFCAAPVIVAREHLTANNPLFLLINAGNANAGTGGAGIISARESCRALADLAGCEMNQVLPFSTGVIGENLPVEKVTAVLPKLLAGLSVDGWSSAAESIMTTDTVPKLVSRQRKIQGKTVTVTGICKGAGMIYPNMATMLAFIATDARVSQGLLDKILESATAVSFNSISIDGDTSTNDACVLVATGASGLSIESLKTNTGQAFYTLVELVFQTLARCIVKDGEGATKLIEILVEGARDHAEARRVAFTIAHSPLVKTAFFAGDPNWGRILAAVGRAGIEGLQMTDVTLMLNDILVVNQGERAASYREKLGQQVMTEEEICVRIELGRGTASVRVLTCDLSFDYVRINATYRS